LVFAAVGGILRIEEDDDCSVRERQESSGTCTVAKTSLPKKLDKKKGVEVVVALPLPDFL
jgi:hypothetical protein